MRRCHLIPLLILTFGGSTSCGGLLKPEDPLRLETQAAGLSGLAIDHAGELWAIPEESRELLRIDRDTGAVRSYPVVGMPDGLEAEALSIQSPGVFLVGTEADEPDRPSDDVVVLRLEGGVARVDEMIRCPYGLWGLEAYHNRGLEGLCAVGDELVVAAEMTGTHEGRRYAPLGRRRADGRWTAFRVWLTTETGKLAGMSCEPRADGGADILAIERHFGVTRILAFTLPPEDEHPDLEPRVLIDLDPWIQSLKSPATQPNFEGLVRIDDDQLALLVDNQYRGERTGPSEIWFVDIPDS